MKNKLFVVVALLSVPFGNVFAATDAPAETPFAREQTPPPSASLAMPTPSTPTAPARPVLDIGSNAIIIVQTGDTANVNVSRRRVRPVIKRDPLTGRRVVIKKHVVIKKRPTQAEREVELARLLRKLRMLKRDIESRKNAIACLSLLLSHEESNIAADKKTSRKIIQMLIKEGVETQLL